MSTILDALRRAEAERERGSIPSLHSQVLPGESSVAKTPGPQGRGWLWAAGTLALLALLALLGLAASPWLARKEQPAGAPVAVAVATAPAAIAQQPSAAPALPPPTSAPVPAPVPVPRQAAAPKPSPLPSPSQQGSVPPPPQDQLPEALRRQLPPLVAGGAMYSDTAAQRMLIINGQVFREGEQIAAELRLEQISLKSAVLSFKGQRFSISY